MNGTRCLAMEKRFSELLNAIINDRYGKSKSVYIVDAQNLALKQRDWIKSVGKLSTTMKNVRPFNVSKVFQLYDLTEAVSKKVEDQDIVVALDHVGAGKSTTLHFIAGSTMTQDPNTGNIYASKVAIPEAADIGVEYKVSESLTRYVNTIPLQLNQVEQGLDGDGHSAKSLITLCDTRGFADSSGPEIYVANGLGVVKALQN